jgi:hypothetical protein
VRGKGLEPFYVSPGTGNYFGKCPSLIWIGSAPPWPRRNATPHQTHEVTIELFIITSVMILIIANAHIPNPNKISTFTSILTPSSKLFKKSVTFTHHTSRTSCQNIVQIHIIPLTRLLLAVLILSITTSIWSLLCSTRISRRTFQEGRLMADPSPENAIFRPIINRSLREVNLHLCI